MSFTPGAGTRFLAFSTTNPSSGSTTLPGPLSITGGTVTANNPVLSATQTWNNAAVTFTGWQLNVTDTASNAASLLMDLQVGGVSRFAVRKSGFVTVGALNFSSTAPASFFQAYSNGWEWQTNGGSDIGYVNNVLYLRSTNSLAWGTVQAGGDLFIARDAANTLAQRNGVNAQTFNIYNTYTDASNYERGFVRWLSNLFEIGTAAAGTGTLRRMVLLPGNGEISFSNEFGLINDVLRVTASNKINWSSLENNVNNGFDDLGLSRAAAGILFVNNGAAGGAAIQMVEQTAPTAPATNGVRIYAEDNGGGKTRLMALFATGAAQQIAIEP